MDVPLIPVLEYYGVEVRQPNRLETVVCCPVHQETVPSCTVNTEKNVMSCKACGFAGDALSLIQRKEGCDFKGSLVIAERITGERIQLEPRRRQPQSRSGRKGAFRPSFRRRGVEGR